MDVEHFIILKSKMGKVMIDFTKDEPLDIEKEVIRVKVSDEEWERRRYEIANRMLGELCCEYYINASTGCDDGEMQMDDICREAVRYADLLIAELKK